MNLQQIIGLRTGSIFGSTQRASSYGGGGLSQRMGLGPTQFAIREPQTFVPGFAHGSRNERKRKKRRKPRTDEERIVSDILQKGHIAKKQRLKKLLNLDPALRKESKSVAEYMETVHRGRKRGPVRTTARAPKRVKPSEEKEEKEAIPEPEKFKKVPEYKLDVQPEETGPIQEPEKFEKVPDYELDVQPEPTAVAEPEPTAEPEGPSESALDRFRRHAGISEDVEPEEFTGAKRVGPSPERMQRSADVVASVRAETEEHPMRTGPRAPPPPPPLPETEPEEFAEPEEFRGAKAVPPSQEQLGEDARVQQLGAEQQEREEAMQQAGPRAPPQVLSEKEMPETFAEEKYEPPKPPKPPQIQPVVVPGEQEKFAAASAQFAASMQKKQQVARKRERGDEPGRAPKRARSTPEEMETVVPAKKPSQTPLPMEEEEPDAPKGFGPSQPIPEHTKAQARRIKQQQRSARGKSDIGPEAYKPKGKAFRKSKKELKKLAEETRQALVQKAKKTTRERFREFAGIGEMPQQIQVAKPTVRETFPAQMQRNVAMVQAARRAAKAAGTYTGPKTSDIRRTAQAQTATAPSPLETLSQHAKRVGMTFPTPKAKKKLSFPKSTADKLAYDKLVQQVGSRARARVKAPITVAPGAPPPPPSGRRGTGQPPKTVPIEGVPAPKKLTRTRPTTVSIAGRKQTLSRTTPQLGISVPGRKQPKLTAKRKGVSFPVKAPKPTSPKKPSPKKRYSHDPVIH